MDVAYVSALSALAGSLIGGTTSGVTTWLNQRYQARAAQIAHDALRREDLIRDFIVAASKAYGDAIGNNDPRMPELVDLYAMLARMRVLSMPRTVGCADKVMRAIIDTYFQPNRTISDMHEVLKSGAGVDPLREFSEVARRTERRLVTLKPRGNEDRCAPRGDAGRPHRGRVLAPFARSAYGRFPTVRARTGSAAPAERR